MLRCMLLHEDALSSRDQARSARLHGCKGVGSGMAVDGWHPATMSKTGRGPAMLQQAEMYLYGFVCKDGVGAGSR